MVNRLGKDMLQFHTFYVRPINPVCIRSLLFPSSPFITAIELFLFKDEPVTTESASPPTLPLSVFPLPYSSRVTAANLLLYPWINT